MDMAPPPPAPQPVPAQARKTLQRRPWAARAFGWLTRLATTLQAWPQRLTPPAFRLVQMGAAYWQSRALYVAARLDLATLLADGEADATTLAGQAGAQPDALARLLRLLTAMGVFEESAPGRWRNNRLSQPLRSDQPGSVRTMLLMHNAPEMSRAWFEQLEQGVRTGHPPFRLQHGRELVDYLGEHPEFDTLFATAMDEVQALTGDSFATEFDWTAFDRVFDLGGGKGSKAVAILERHPHLKAVVVDRAPVIRQAERHWPQRKPPALLARLSYASRDLRVSLPAAGSARDAYLLSAVLHGFDDDTASALLRRVAAAAAPVGATIVVLDLVMPDQRADLASALFDLQMFVGTRGRERTRAEWSVLFERSGLDWVETVRLASFGSMLVLRSPPTAQRAGPPEGDQAGRERPGPA